METKKRIRPTLAQYRKLEDKLLVANGHIELGTKQLSDLQRKHDIQEQANKFLKEAIDTNNKDLCRALAMVGAWKTHCVSFKKNGDRAIRLNWYLIALIVALNICLICR